MEDLTIRRSKRRNSGIYWTAPTTIGVSLLNAVLLAAGHHAFYSSLVGKVAGDSDYNMLVAKISEQQLNIAGGTAFACLVKASLVTAVATSYIQLFWREMAHQSREMTLSSLDDTFSALTNFLLLLKARNWSRHPLLFLIAAACWLLPLAAIVTPATLSIESHPVSPAPVSSRQVPNLDFVSLNMVNSMTPKWHNKHGPNQAVPFQYTGPSRAVQNIAQAVAADGEVLPIIPPAPNSTWKLEFPGPTLQCSNVSDKFRTAILSNIVDAISSTSLDSCQAFGFLAWTSSGNASLTEPLPFMKTGNGSYQFNTGALNANAFSPAMIYLAAMPIMMWIGLGPHRAYIYSCEKEGGVWSGNLDGIESAFYGSTMIQCALTNSTYRTEFDFINGRQRVNIKTMPIEEEPLTTIGWVMGPGEARWPGSKMRSPDCNPLHLQGGARCAFNATLLRTLSYQAVMQAFNEVFTGTVFVKKDEVTQTVESGVLDTMLVETPELQFLTRTDIYLSFDEPTSLQSAILASNGSLFNGIINNASSTRKQPLIEAMETTFQKITVSLMTSRKLQSNPQSVFAPPPANVTFHTYHNIYVYSAFKLWIAYGTALFVAVILSSIGLVAITANKASYSPNFSSVFRFARGAFVNETIHDEDTIGRDPLPEYLSTATVSFNRHKASISRTEHRIALDSSTMLKALVTDHQDQGWSLRDFMRNSRYRNLDRFDDQYL